MTNATETFQISPEQAEMYEAKYVPAIFAQWAPLLVDAARVTSGQSVLDVACGTGILARTAADRVGPSGRVVGLDLNEGMLAVARRLRPELEWRRGDAVDLPFVDDSFDAVLCQSSLMFFPDATAALREMGRVCRPGGVVGVQVYRSLDAQPAYRPWIEMVARHAGPEAFSLLSTYWVHGDHDILRRRFEVAGLTIDEFHTHGGLVRWASIDEMVEVEIQGTPLIDRINEEVYRAIQQESQAILGKYRTGTGLAAPIQADIVTARKA